MKFSTDFASFRTIYPQQECYYKASNKGPVDHKNKLDNRKSNLRIVTHAQNAMNKTSAINSSSKYLGVHFDKRLRSGITIDGKRIELGSFEEEAAFVKDEAFGSYNFTELFYDH